MPEEMIPVYAEWALQGKTLGRAGARVLACSNGALNEENFTELISRFSLGTPDRFPQVSVSYLKSGVTSGRAYYLGMAIHKWAADVQTDGGELLERDDDSRPVAATAYFCVPYHPPSKLAVTYQSMYQEFNRVRLDTTGGPPLLIQLPSRTSLPAVNAFAMQSASRLFTGRPVCVLGAGLTTVEERLAFIEAVTQLIPYGFRTRLTAATWVRSTHRDHRFRLFFSTDKRDAKTPDEVVYWGQPERTALTPADDIAFTYYQWLSGTVGQLEILAKLTAPRSFSPDDILESLDRIGIHRTTETIIHRRSPAGDPQPAPRPPAPQPPSQPKHAELDVEQILRVCAESMRTPHIPNLGTAITRLKSRKVRSKIGPEEGSRYRQIIKDEHLFRCAPGLGELQHQLREALLNIAFTPALSYEDYCLIEDSCLTEGGATQPDLGLLRLILGRISDLPGKAVVYGQMPPEDVRGKLDGWHKSTHVTPIAIIDAVLAGPWYRPVHALRASRTAADLMHRRAWDPGPIREVLHSHGYLAHLLAAVGQGHNNTQVYALSTFLKTAYPDGLTDRNILEILTGAEHAPSLALLVAVLFRISPADAPRTQLAREAYIHAITREMGLKLTNQEALAPRLFWTDIWPGDLTVGRNSHPGTGQA